MANEIDIETGDYFLRTVCGIVVIVWNTPATASKLKSIEEVIIPWFRSDKSPHAILMVSTKLKESISDPEFSGKASEQAKRLIPYVKAVAVVQPEMSMTDRLLNITARVVATMAGGVVPLKIHQDVLQASKWLKTLIPTLDEARLAVGVHGMLRRYPAISAVQR